MDLKKKIAHNADSIERFLIILIFFVILLHYFVGSEDQSVFPVIVIVLQAALIIFYYNLLHTRIYGLLWACFLLGILAFFIPGEGIGPYVRFILNALGYVVFGIIVLIRTFRMSIRNKNFELLNFIMGFLLVLQLALPFFMLKGDEVVTFYGFALSFAMGTIIYNDNLWHRYNPDEKNVIKYILIVSLVLVIQSSLKYLSI